jgi:hypothetical protein
MRRTVGVAGVVILLAGWPGGGDAQAPAGQASPGGGAQAVVPQPAAPWRAALFAQERDRTVPPGVAFLASALLPGAGQRLQGQDRWVPYLALEAWGWLDYRRRRNAGHRLEERYRELAWSVARRVSTGERRDTVFEYYEAMAHWEASGVFDLDGRTPAVQPERDPGTYNGMIWQLAVAIYVPRGAPAEAGTAAYEAALRYYERHAVPPGYAWSWGAAGLEQQVFQELIRESDEALRAASRVLGLILANHAVSAVDALLVSRLRAQGPERVQVGLESALLPGSRGPRWGIGMRVGLPGR